MEEPGFKIGGELIPFPDSYTFGDTVLIKRLTGMPMQEFAEALTGETGDQGDALIGVLGAAVWHKHPGWKIDRVEQYVLGLKLDDLEVIAEEADDDPLPAAVPDAAAVAEPSSRLSPGLNGEPEEPASVVPLLERSGTPA